MAFPKYYIIIKYVYYHITKDKRMIILYAVPISLWPTLGKENCYFYTRHPNNNDLCILPNTVVAVAMLLLLY